MADEQETSEEQLTDRVLGGGGGLQSLDQHRPDSLIVLTVTQRPLFPGLTVPINFTGEDVVATVQEVMRNEEGYCAVVLADNDYTESASDDDEEEAQKNTSPSKKNLRDVGTLFRIQRVIPVSETNVQVLGVSLVRCERVKQTMTEPHHRWKVRYHEIDRSRPTPDLRAYMMAISTEIKNLISLNPHFKEQVNMVVDRLNYESPSLTLDVLSNLLNAEAEILQNLLETPDPLERAKEFLQLAKQEVEVARIQENINQQISDTVSEQQRKFFLNEQLKVIKKELGLDKEGPEAELESLQERISALDLPSEAQTVANQELRKLATLNAQSPEFNVTRSYLELIADLPWSEFTSDTNDIKKARAVLERDHYGLDDVKNNILEFLATIVRRGRVAGSIICLVGPPGVGKTSIGKSIAEALGRKFFRFSVGGMRDEAEIKGHRRTYIGAMPGKLIQAIKRAESSNPVIMLDEIDKIGSSGRGDPASTLLEVLDPEQNDAFVDHYLDVPYDLSNVLFITTANSLDSIPRPLLDRMEVIRLSGYIKEEKVQIAKRFLLPKQLEELGFEKEEVSITEEALNQIADEYAREAGVRNLEKQIRKILRKVSLELAEMDEGTSEEDIKIVEANEVTGYLGKPLFDTEELYNTGIPGVALGLAYTSLGGTTLYIEATAIESGKFGFRYTGQLGDVMKESADIAYSYVRSRCERESISYFDNHFVHLHVPAGATPKDGPSAGITMALALYSLAKDNAVREGLAMTGELTLTGKVLPIGGVREKTIGARRVHVDTLIFPKANQRDWEELPAHITEGVEVHFADYFDDVLEVALGQSTQQKASKNGKSSKKKKTKV